MINRLRTLAVAFFTFALPAAAMSADEVVLYGTVDGTYSSYTGQLLAVVQKSIDDLDRFDIAAATVKPESLKDAAALVTDARRKGNNWVADFTMDFSKRRRAEFTLDIYDAKKGIRTVRINKTYKFKNIKALLSELEFDVPKALKNHFLELGRVIKKERRLVYFDLGQTAGVKVGDAFKVFREGEEIKDESGNSFGRIERTVGIVRVASVTAIYSTAEILVGALSIESGDYVKRMEKNQSNVKPEIMSVLENQVAISIGKNLGVEEGAYYAVYKDIKSINNDQSFKHPIGYIKVDDVYDDFATGELEISTNFEMAKYTIKAGDRVEEVESPKKDTIALAQYITNISGDQGQKLIVGTFQKSSAANVNIAYRIRAGYGKNGYYFSTGVMHALKHNPYFYAGVDFIGLAGLPINIFFTADIDTPLSSNIKLSLESGYTIGATDETYNGINSSVGVKYGFDLF